ncbi:hypothetical protein NAI45_09770, partial [Francisella tularensis subsp. holarctica]|nr:hypothetical protein [Francisella tularensis subsp. holarctica]
MNVNILALVVAIMVLLIIMFYKIEKILNKYRLIFMINKILFGITGSISDFQTINLIRLFIKSGVECRS